MTVMLGRSALEGAIGMRDAIDLLEATHAHEAAGATSVLGAWGWVVVGSAMGRCHASGRRFRQPEPETARQSHVARCRLYLSPLVGRGRTAKRSG